MGKIKKFRKVIVVMLMLTMATIMLPIGSFVSAAGVYLEISAPSAQTINEGSSIKFTLIYNGDVASIGLGTGSIVLNGFTANKSISGTGNVKTVTLSDVKGNGSGKSISITGGTAISSTGALANNVTSSAFSITAAAPQDSSSPVLSISGPNPSKVNVGGTVSYTLTYSDNEGVASIGLGTGSIVLNGFTANKSISGTGNTRTVTLSNIQGSAGASKTISVTGGTAIDAVGNLANAATSSAFSIENVSKDTTSPVLSISGPNSSQVYAGETVSYTLTYSDNEGVASIGLGTGSIVLNGFTANKSISGTGNTRTVTLSDIQGSVGGNKSISVTGGTAIDAAGNLANAAISSAFSIVNKTVVIPTIPTTPTTPSTPTTTTVTTGPKVVTDLDYKNLGDINPEITYFASWLRAEKYTKSVVQENNYVAKDETMTYMVEFYNGSTAPTPNAKFTLTIPEAAVIEEINGNGKVIEQTSQKTVIEWNIGKFEAGKATRAYVRVKFLADETLEKSGDISKVFYAELLTNANGNTSYSYMRQQFIDRSTSKTGIFTKYLMALDSTNAIRPEDEITRAEFAKLLADCGILKVDTASTKYKVFTDADKIPEYARAAVSALVGTDIIQAFSDGSFKPNNPILREDLIQMVANASTYMSGTKLTVTKPVFLYTDILKDKNGKISANKDFIMESVRQNVLPKYASAVRPDEYTKRSEAVTVINALTFRGPFVQNLPQDTMKFADIMDHKYFYDLIGASNTYVYNYDYRLWQNITAVK